MQMDNQATNTQCKCEPHSTAAMPGLHADMRAAC
jgi:hypothetical protein